MATIYDFGAEARRRGRALTPRPVLPPVPAPGDVSALELEDALAWVERDACAHAPGTWCRHRRVLQAVGADLSGVTESRARVHLAARLEVLWFRVGRMYVPCEDASDRAVTRVLERARRRRSDLAALERAGKCPRRRP